MRTRLSKVLPRLAIGTLVVACSGDAGVNAPTDIVRPVDTVRGPDPRTYTISGLVTEITAQGESQSSGAYVNAWVQQANTGYSYWYLHGRNVADSAGRYKLPSIPAGATAYLQVWKEGHVQQCAAPALTIRSDTTLNAQLVSTANVSAASSSVPAPTSGLRHVSGVIYETTDSGRQQLAGVFVDYEPVMDYVGAFTITDAGGRYLLCGIPDDRTVTIGVGLGRRFTYMSVPPGRSTGVDIALPR